MWVITARNRFLIQNGINFLLGVLISLHRLENVDKPKLGTLLSEINLPLKEQNSQLVKLEERMKF